jgi:hypothetical protein
LSGAGDRDRRICNLFSVILAAVAHRSRKKPFWAVSSKELRITGFRIGPDSGLPSGSGRKFHFSQPNVPSPTIKQKSRGWGGGGCCGGGPCGTLRNPAEPCGTLRTLGPPCSTTLASPLQHPPPLQHPCSTHPCCTLAAPLQHPCSTHPCCTLAAPLQHEVPMAMAGYSVELSHVLAITCSSDPLFSCSSDPLSSRHPSNHIFCRRISQDAAAKTVLAMPSSSDALF